MSDASPNGTPASPGGGRKLSLEAISQAFQQELEAGRRPKIEKVLSQLKEKYHERVLRNLMIAEIGFLRRRGKSLLQADYLARFSAFPGVVKDVFDFLGQAPLARPLPSALKSAGAVSMIASQSSLDFPIAIDESSAIETSTELKRGADRLDGRTTSSGDTTTHSKPRANPGQREAPARSNSPAGGQPQKAAPQNGAPQKSSEQQKAPGQKSPAQKAPGQRVSGQRVSDQKSPGQKKPAPKSAAPPVDHYDDDLNSLLSVQLPQEPRRKKTAEEIEEARERLERRKERQRKKDRDKRLKVKIDDDEITQHDAGPKVPLGEFQLPLIVTIVSAILNLVVALMITQEGLPLGVFLIVKLVILAFSFATMLAALFVAAFVLGTQYGYLHTAILKVAAICLTQAWISNLWYVVPLPVVYEASCWIATFVMFELFFEIDTMDVVYSMIIVNVTRMIIGIYLAMLLFYMLESNAWFFEKAAVQMQEQAENQRVEARINNVQAVNDARSKAQAEIDAVAKDEKFGEIPKGAAPQAAKEDVGNDGENEQPVVPVRPDRKVSPEKVDAMMKYTHQFANLIIVEDFETAYEMMSTEYRDENSLVDFKTRLIDWRNEVGYPIGAKEQVESLEAADIQNRLIARDLNLPDDKILAVTAIRFTMDLDEEDQMMAARFGEDLEQQLDLLLINEDGRMKIAEFGPGF